MYTLYIQGICSNESQDEISKVGDMSNIVGQYGMTCAYIYILIGERNWEIIK